MAVTASIYPSALGCLLNATIDLDTHAVNIALLDADAVFDATHTEFADVSGDEVAATGGYVAGGQVLTTPAVAVTDGVASVDFDDAVWTSSTISASSAVIYDDTASGNPLIGFIDFGGAVTSDAGDFTVTLAAGGLLTLSEA